MTTLCTLWTGSVREPLLSALAADCRFRSYRTKTQQPVLGETFRWDYQRIWALCTPISLEANTFVFVFLSSHADIYAQTKNSFANAIRVKKKASQNRRCLSEDSNGTYAQYLPTYKLLFQTLTNPRYSCVSLLSLYGGMIHFHLNSFPSFWTRTNTTSSTHTHI